MPDTETPREGHVTAKDFNPSNNESVDKIKAKVEELAQLIKDECPASRRRSVALTNLETCSMYAVKSIFYPEG